MIDTTAIEAIRESRSSIELKRDSKGTYSWAIKLYFDRGIDDDDQEMALSQLRRVDANLRTLFIPKGDSE